MSKTGKIEGTDEAWESGQLGRDAAHARVYKKKDNFEPKIDESLELQLISIRLQKSLIEDLKAIAKLNGIGYQPLVRQVLRRFADCEQKNIMRRLAAEQPSVEDGDGDDTEPPKAATG